MFKRKSKTICFIPARKGSKRVKDKNLRKINNKTLIEIAYRKAKKNKLKYFCLSTEAETIRKIANSFGLKSFFTTHY